MITRSMRQIQHENWIEELRRAYVDPLRLLETLKLTAADVGLVLCRARHRVVVSAKASRRRHLLCTGSWWGRDESRLRPTQQAGESSLHGPRLGCRGVRTSGASPRGGRHPAQEGHPGRHTHRKFRPVREFQLVLAPPGGSPGRHEPPRDRVP